MAELLPHLVLETIGRNPEKECIISAVGRVTYGEVERQIRGAAEVLNREADPGERIAVLMENSVEYVAACYGTWMVGAVLVGLNPALRAEELSHLIRHSGAQCLIADPEHPELDSLRTMLDPDVRVLEVGPGQAFIPRGEDLPGGSLRATALASIVYTSGTTGHPKGVQLSHGALAANTDSILRSLPVRSADKVLTVLPFQYSYGASVLHTHLVKGGTLVLERSFLYPHLVVEKMASERVTTLPGVPSTFKLLMRRVRLQDYDLSSLRYVTSAGGPMDHEQIFLFRKTVPGVDFYVMYGQTEAAPRVTCLPAEDIGRKNGSAGKPIPGVEIRIVGRNGKDLSPHEDGEVCVRGENLMLGYWSDEEETSQVLKDGWLYTGDLGHVDEEGYLFLSGRLREMIKSGAHRIAPAAIEEIIRGVPGVTDVVVTGVEDDVLGEVPKAWVIPSGKEPDLRRRILRTCQTRLARFKVPREVVFVREFPLGATGKVRRHLLEEITGNQGDE